MVAAAVLIALGGVLQGIIPFANSQESSKDLASTDELVDSQSEPEEIYPHIISPRSTLYSILRELDVTPQTIHEIVKAAKPHADLGRIRPGTRFQLIRPATSAADIIGIKFKFSPIEKLSMTKDSIGWTAEKIVEPVDKTIVTFSGVVTSSLWESAAQAQMDPNLISELSEIFAWQVDFAREVRAQDRWRLSVEQLSVKGENIGWGSILSAEYENAGQSHVAILFRKDGKNLGYFAPDGSSLRRMFLKSPIKFARISSRFQKARFHPILKTRRPHLGVDYAAPRGTPVRTVGSGVVTFVGRSGGGGKIIRIRHNSTYQTAYKHLNGYARGIRKGVKVDQGQVIGFVGSTGMSTGPHLHFEFFQSGRYVDPLGKKFPSADPVPSQYLTEFKSEALSLMNLLPDWHTVQVSSRETNTEVL